MKIGEIGLQPGRQALSKYMGMVIWLSIELAKN